jgi:hypothetical protein
MSKTKKLKGILFTCRMPQSGVTVYLRQGELITRSVHSKEKRSNTSKQFVQRQRMRHSIALWKALKPCQPLFTNGKTNYNGFITLANRLPVVFVSKFWEDCAALLMPDIPVSEGTLLPIKQQIGMVDGTPALMTNLKATEWEQPERWMLYTAEQLEGDTIPMVRFKVREVPLDEFTEVDGCLALVDNEFSNEMKGWALVRMAGDRCSSQGIVTRCTYYERFTTEEAMQKAAESYGGLT